MLAHLQRHCRLGQLKCIPLSYPLNRRNQSTTQSKTHFGFQQVNEEDKKGLVADVFHGVADKYDIMNDFMSGGMHRIWKDSFITMMDLFPHREGEPLRILDVAGGTGDIAFRIGEVLRKRGVEYSSPSEKSDIVVCDINQSMLNVGEKRAIEKGFGKTDRRPTISWICGDAENLELESNSFDLYTIAFGIRNVTDINKALREAHRVLRKGGRFMCLEFSKVQNPLLSAVYDKYSFLAIPKIGEIVANDRASYQYLVESIRQFPPQEEFKCMIENAGFSHVNYTNLTNGVVAIHSGFKL